MVLQKGAMQPPQQVERPTNNVLRREELLADLRKKVHFVTSMLNAMSHCMNSMLQISRVAFNDLHFKFCVCVGFHGLLINCSKPQIQPILHKKTNF